jgi:hypothetical protein
LSAMVSATLAGSACGGLTRPTVACVGNEEHRQPAAPVAANNSNIGFMAFDTFLVGTMLGHRSTTRVLAHLHVGRHRAQFVPQNGSKKQTSGPHRWEHM